MTREEFAAEVADHVDNWRNHGQRGPRDLLHILQQLKCHSATLFDHAYIDDGFIKNCAVVAACAERLATEFGGQ